MPLGITGTVRYMVFFAIVVKTRAVEIAGIATHPDGKWMQQMARNLTDSVDGISPKCYLPDPRPRSVVHRSIRSNTGRARGEVREDSRAKPKLQPACGAFCQNGPGRVLESSRPFRRATSPVRHQGIHGPYHRERFRQGLGRQLIEAQTSSANEKMARGEVVCRSWLGGMLNYYHREAA
jgi:hypothetical protein